jgi:hypothetical protein
MKVMGFRADPNAPRYAIASDENGAHSLLNADGDSKLTIPVSLADDADEKRIHWLYREIEQVFEAHQGISKVIIKCNEYTQQETKAKRKSAYLDAAVMLCCAQKGIPVEVKIYASMGTTSADTRAHAESRVGRTAKYWDAKMADAVNAAWWGLRHP